MKKYLCFTVFVLLCSTVVFGDAIELKTGEIIRGKITRQTPVYIRIESHDGITMREYLKETIEAVYQGEIEPADLPVDAVEKETATEEGKREDGLEAAVAGINEQIDIDVVAPTLIIEGEPLQDESEAPVPDEAVMEEAASAAKDPVAVETLKVFQFQEAEPVEEEAESEMREPAPADIPEPEKVTIPAPVLDEQTAKAAASDPAESSQTEESHDLTFREQLSTFRQFNLVDSFAEQQGGVTYVKISSEHIILFLMCYIFLCMPLFLIAKKTLTKTALLAFLPLINVIYMCAVGRKPLWWFFLLLLPVVQVIIFALIWGGIAEACHKSKWMGVLMLIPIANLILPWYLAISKEG